MTVTTDLRHLGRCCTNGFLHEGITAGSYKTINGIQTYFCETPSKSREKAIFIFTDAIGHSFINTQLIADNFAANGFFTVVPDLFAGDPIPLNSGDDFDTVQWMKNHLPEKVNPIVRTIIQQLRGTTGCKQVAGVGYCIGAQYMVKYLKEGILDVGFIAHPTHLEQMDLLGIEKPLSVATAALDNTFVTQKRQEMEAVLRKADAPYQVVLYSNVEHGFAVRGNDTDPHGRFAKEQAFNQAVQWIKHYTKEATSENKT